MKTSRLFTLDIEIVEKLKLHPNGSKLVNDLLREHFGTFHPNPAREIELEEQQIAKKKRKFALKRWFSRNSNSGNSTNTHLTGSKETTRTSMKLSGILTAALGIVLFPFVLSYSLLKNFRGYSRRGYESRRTPDSVSSNFSELGAQGSV